MVDLQLLNPYRQYTKIICTENFRTLIIRMAVQNTKYHLYTKIWYTDVRTYEQYSYIRIVQNKALDHNSVTPIT